MIYCFDTYYFDDSARTAVVGIENWDSETPSFELIEIIHNSNDYESGAFYKKELPCLLSILKKVDLNTNEDLLIIDGYVQLSDDGKLGLGGYLYEELERKIPIIGVAKNNFFTIQNLKKEVYRGESKKPLYVTSIGMSLEEASERILEMEGKFRIPTILKLVDQKSRG